MGWGGVGWGGCFVHLDRFKVTPHKETITLSLTYNVAWNMRKKHNCHLFNTLIKLTTKKHQSLMGPL